LPNLEHDVCNLQDLTLRKTQRGTELVHELGSLSHTLVEGRPYTNQVEIVLGERFTFALLIAGAAMQASPEGFVLRTIQPLSGDVRE
jgi:hypothetical protein